MAVLWCADVNEEGRGSDDGVVWIRRLDEHARIESKPVDPEVLAAVLRGDLRAYEQLEKDSPGISAKDTEGLPPLVLTRAAVRAVLEALQEGRVDPGLVERWAWFVLDGAVPYTTGPPAFGIDIEFEAEDEMVEVLARLRELGDEIDGEIGEQELADMIASMS